MVTSTSIAAQLQAIKSFVKADAEPLKKPFTRPSLLFDPKEAADTDLDTIFSIALSGLESLVSVDERFRAYSNDLFSHKSRGLDRELMNIEENNRINITIASYLRLISGHLRLPAAFKTLEYLIRRYKIHVYNMEELILCALPYHDTHAFVRIVQLIDLGNTKWKFLGGVKVSGAPPPRKIIVQQCIRDFGVLESLCSYATPTKKDQQSMPAVSFCIAVVVELLGSVATVDSDCVKRILPFVAGIQSGAKGISDYKAGALMIIGVLANRATLSEKLVKSLLRTITDLAQEAESTDIQWFQMTMMALINLVQLQSVPMLPKKVLDSVIRFRDLSQVISGLAIKFNIEKFLRVFVSSLINYSESDDLFKTALISILKDVPLKGVIHYAVSRFLSACLRVAQNLNSSDLPQSGTWVKQVLVVINEKYSEEFRNAFHKFMEDAKVQSKGESLVFECLCKMLDGTSNVEMSDSKIWFALEHPKAEIRRAMLCSLDTSKLLDGGDVNYQRFMSVQDAVIRRLYDDDLDVIKAALSLDRLSELIGSIKFLEVLPEVLKRSTNILLSGTSKDSTKAGDICLSCLELAVTNFEHKEDCMEVFASMVFPFLLVFPKTKKLSLKVQELIGKINWPFYRKLSFPEIKNSEQGSLFMNTHIISSLSEVFSESPGEYMPWLVKCSNNYELSKTIFILILRQSCLTLKNDARISSLLIACFKFLQNEWIALEQYGDLLTGEEVESLTLNGSCIELLDQLQRTSHRQLNAKIILCTFWNLVCSYLSALPTNISWDDNGEWFRNFSELYVFFAERKLRSLFTEHLQYIAQNLKVSPINFFSMFITSEGFSSGVQIASLRSLTALCSPTDESLAVQLFHGFPSVLVPLSSEAQDVRAAAMDFVEGLFSLWSRIQSTGKRNGNNESWGSSVDGLLRLLVQQKKLIISDRSFLAALFASVLSSSPQGLLVPEERFDKSTMEDILGFTLGFAMKLSAYAKLKILLIFKDAGAQVICIKDVQSLLSELLQRLQGSLFQSNNSCQKLSNTEVDILCLLLEMCCIAPSPDVHVQDKLLAALQIDDVSVSDPTILRPCTTVLLKLNDCVFNSLTSETQDFLLHKLVLLHQSSNNTLQNSAKDALLRLTITSSPFIRMLEDVDLSDERLDLTTQQVRKKSKKCHLQKADNISGHKSSLGFVSSLLDVLLLKKDIMNRVSLVKPLFQLLGRVFSGVKIAGDDKEGWVQAASGISQSIHSTICYIQRTILLILEDIARSISLDILSNDCIVCDSDIKLLVECASSSKEVPVLNQAFSLFSTVAKIIPRVALPHIPDILAVTCKSTISQEDSYSKSVFEDLISAVIPCWLSNGKDNCSFLQIFIEVMGDVAQHRRLAVVLHILRTLGEQQSLGSLFALLIRSMVTKPELSPPDDGKYMSDFINTVTQTEWQYRFALEICQHYSTTTWLPSLVVLLKIVQSGDRDQQRFMELLYAVKFVQERFLDPELLFKFDAEDGSDVVQGTLGQLVEQVVCCLVLVDSIRDRSILPAPFKKEVKEQLHSLLINMTKKMIPSTLFRATSILMGRAERNVTKKALRLLCETVRDNGAVKSCKRRDSNVYLTSAWDKLDGSALDTLFTLCSEILQMVDQSHDDEPDQSLKLAAVSAVEVLASRVPSTHPISNKCLSSMVKNILSDDVSVASSCLKTTGAFISILGARALPELPGIMANILKQSRNLQSPLSTDTGMTGQMEKIMLSLLLTLEALVEKLGSFLNPYLTDILELLVLNPSCISDSDQKLKTKAEAVRQLLSEQIPVRLALPPLLKLYPEAVKSGDLSLRIVFEMLTSFVSRMDRASVSSYHGEIFNLLLLAFDLRRQHHPTIKRIKVVEEYVNNAMVALTLKLTETMFKPLFIRCIEWVESTTEEFEHIEKIDRAIAFYHLVNKLAESHRSLFVPYFKYLLKGCVEYLSEDGKSGARSRKNKKAKLDKTESQNVNGDAAALGNWHLCALVVSSLHKCFLYDTGKQMFLDSSNFQELLKPIVAQMVSVPPPSLEEFEPDVPSEKEVDDRLVSCIAQMAVAAGLDQWKQLNHEVLMQTRSEAVRARILGLKIVKKLIENLKEEYLDFLAETIPFLVELLEDAQLSVKTLAQETIKELELLSGEDLRQYF